MKKKRYIVSTHSGKHEVECQFLKETGVIIKFCNYDQPFSPEIVAAFNVMTVNSYVMVKEGE
ncbi:hypothetical protein [Salipaludibacillus aurantiacus]|uniref:hypothetical protein n=1 Tax=Salipaludibacillus aurantiacus TaxID=1601833 RepID=UPI000B864C83|nr:hypothetical protein [Salipaludibacillus aurantiacus]